MNTKLLVIIAAIVVVIGGALAAVFLFVLPGMSGGEAKPTPPPTIQYYKPGDYIVTNIRDSARLIKATIVLEYEEDKDPVKAADQLNYLKKNEHIIRDVIIFTIRGKDEGELRSEEIRDSLREEITQKLKERLELPFITTVIYNDFVLQ